MTDPILAAFVVLMCCLLAVAAVPDELRRRAAHACTGLAAAGVLLSALTALLDRPPSLLALPLGLPGQHILLALDPVAAGLLLLVFVAGMPAAAFAAATAPQGSPPPASVPLALAGLTLSVLSADATAVAIGVSVIALACWGAMSSGRARSIGLAVRLIAAAALFLAFAFMPPERTDGPAGGPSVSAASLGCHAAAVMCALGAAGTLAGLPPMRGLILRAVRDTPPAMNALLFGGVAPIALGLLIRVTLGGNQEAAVWWVWILIPLGAVTTLTAGWQAATGVDLSLAAVMSVQRLAGLAIIDLGLVLLGKSADVPELAGLALASMMLFMAVMTVCGPLAILAAAVLQERGGSRRPDRLGGLLHFMPVTSMVLLAGLGGMAALPPAAAFAGHYLAFQAVLSAPSTPGLVTLLLLAGTVAVQGVGSALGAASAVRLVGVTCLGRPRTPRAAAGTEPPAPIRTLLIGLAGVSAVLGLFPGPLLNLFGGAPIAQLTGLELGDRTGLLHLGAGSGYAPIPLAILLAMCGGMVLWIRWGGAAAKPVPVWQDGFPSVTGWMPFGDPLTQSSGAGFVSALPSARLPSLLRHQLPAFRPPAVRRLLIRIARVRAALAMLTVLAVVLAVLTGGANG